MESGEKLRERFMIVNLLCNTCLMSGKLSQYDADSQR